MAPETASYQNQVKIWFEACFPASAQSDRLERTHRFLEEALELAQANGCTLDDARALVKYVFDRPPGDPAQEVGGVLVTLACLCSVGEIDMETSGNIELARNWERIDLIRSKFQAKPHGSPLPK